MEEYIAAKENIFTHMRPGGRLVLNAENDYTRDMANRAADGTDLLFFGKGGDICERDGYNVRRKKDTSLLGYSSAGTP